MYEKLSLYVDGQFISGEGRKMQDVINPATQEVLGQLPHASNADLDMALQAAQKAFATWKKPPTPPAANSAHEGRLSRGCFSLSANWSSALRMCVRVSALACAYTWIHVQARASCGGMHANMCKHVQHVVS